GVQRFCDQREIRAIFPATKVSHSIVNARSRELLQHRDTVFGALVIELYLPIAYTASPKGGRGMRVGVRLATALVAIAVQVGSVGAATCQQAELSAAGKQTDGKLRCETRAVKLGAAVDAECLDSVEIDFQRAFLNAENRGGCLDTANAGVVESAVDACVAGILSALGASSPPPPPAVCLQAKLKASAKRASGKMSCWSRAAARNDVVDDSCLARAESRFDGAFAKAELRGGCARTGDAAAVAAAVDTCVQDVVDLLQPATTSTTTVTPSSTSTTLPGVCGGNEPAALAGVTAAQNAVRANASPTPNPPL